eukprot:COSAG01_NODE_57616_length_311_cov_0.726415_2_plen_81_part_01
MHEAASGRVDAVDKLLECMTRMIATSVGRKDRKELMKRVDALEDLDEEEIPAWMASPWTAEQAAAVTEASETLWAQEDTTG